MAKFTFDFDIDGIMQDIESEITDAINEDLKTEEADSMFRKLPSNSEKVLDEIMASDNPAQMLARRFHEYEEQQQYTKEDELRGILGELEGKFVIRLDGVGSVFPVYEIHEPGQPLWYVKCDWDDPTYDLFSDCVAININTAHKNYKYLDKTKRTFDEQLLKEIMASALGVIITKLKEQENYWDVTTIGEDLQSGSVSEAINYFINTLEWDVSGPESLSLSIRKFFDQRM